QNYFDCLLRAFLVVFTFDVIILAFYWALISLVDTNISVVLGFLHVRIEDNLLSEAKNCAIFRRPGY
ncbi:hypothetical protein IW262DRAFT_1496587, partial [Armillaria fumosa]